MPKPIVIVDLDGTLADVRHRLHFVQGPGKKRWKRFFQAQENDIPVASVRARIHELSREHEIVIVTARPDICREGTERWLEKHEIPYWRMYMRSSGDHRPDYVVKREILGRIGKERVVQVFEDRPLVCRMYRDEGLEVVEIESDQASQAVNSDYERTGMG